MTIDTVRGSTAGGSLLAGDDAMLGDVLGGARCEAHGLPALGVAHGLDGHRRIAAQRPAELADDAGVGAVDVHLLADKRRATAVCAAVAISREDPDATAQEEALELFGIGGGGRSGCAHAEDFATPRRSPAGLRRRRLGVSGRG
jgi:hypothetical protein